MMDQALGRRPDIAALRATLAAKEDAVKAVGSLLWPSLYLNGNIARDYYNDIGGRETQDNDWSYAGALSLQWTLFDGGQTLNARRAAAAQADSVRAQLKQAELAASADVWTRFQNYDTALQKYKFSAAFLKSATASYDAATESYKAGLRSFLELLNSEPQLTQARSLQVAARQEIFTALANLAYASGLMERGGTAPDQERTTLSTGKDQHP